MRRLLAIAFLISSSGLGMLTAGAQAPAPAQSKSFSGAGDTRTDSAPGPVVLDWTPPALAQLSAEAAVRNSFTLDRTMLSAASGLLPDSEASTKRAIGKLDGVSVHLLRFSAAGLHDEAAIDSIRDAYHLRGWKHVVTTAGSGGPVHNGTTDVWVVMDGVNLRGAVVLAETPNSLTLATVAGNLSPVDLLHLRGHFGIPKFDSDALEK